MDCCLERFKAVSSNSVVGVQGRRRIRDREFISLRMIGQGWLAELTKNTAYLGTKAVGSGCPNRFKHAKGSI